MLNVADVVEWVQKASIFHSLYKADNILLHLHIVVFILDVFHFLLMHIDIQVLVYGRFWNELY